MTSLAGFSLLQDQPPPFRGTTPLGEIVDLKFGQDTGWQLSVSMETDGQSICVTFPNVVSFRAQDEAHMLQYWPVRDSEGVDVGTIYVIDRSPYKDEFQSGSVAGLHVPLTHYLVAGNNLCVEVLVGANEGPTISRA